MSVDPVYILAAPFERGVLDLPTGRVPTGRVVLFNAHAFGDTCLQDTSAMLDCIQPLRPQYLQLQQQGANAFARLDQLEKPDGGFAMAMVLASRHRGLNEANIGLAIQSTQKGGLIVVAGEKTSGIAALRKALGKEVEIADSMAKHHGVAFWFENPGKLDNWQIRPETVDLGDGLVAETAPGMFSHGKVDTGSRLLAERFDEKITGKIADFGSGWGYLGAQLLKKCPKIETLSCHEADFNALEVSQKLLAQVDDGEKCRFHWHDLIREPVERQFDWVIMNPPFHAGRKSSVDLGHVFIERAGQALRARGKMLMVANNHLAYERKLEAVFPRFEIIDQRDGFKIIKAWR